MFSWFPENNFQKRARFLLYPNWRPSFVADAWLGQHREQPWPILDEKHANPWWGPSIGLLATWSFESDSGVSLVVSLRIAQQRTAPTPHISTLLILERRMWRTDYRRWRVRSLEFGPVRNELLCSRCCRRHWISLHCEAKQPANSLAVLIFEGIALSTPMNAVAKTCLSSLTKSYYHRDPVV